jgi:hypothetical protein
MQGVKAQDTKAGNDAASPEKSHAH